MGALDRFRDVLCDAGQPTDEIIPDGRIHRYEPPSGKRGRKPCWYKLHELPSGHLVGHYGDWRISDKGNEFHSWQNGAAHPDPEDRRYLAEAAAVRKRAEQELEAAHRKAASDAEREWPKLSPMGESQYLLRKGVGAYGIKFGRDERGNFIAVPMRAGREWRGIQRIYENGDKHFPSGTEKKGAYAIVGHFTQDGCIYPCEGYATAATLHEATGGPGVVAFDAYNVMEVIERLIAERVPRRNIVACLDNDQWTERGNTGARIAEEIRYRFNVRTVLPSFDGYDTSKKPTDFNDLASLAGIAEVRRQLGFHLGIDDKRLVIPKISALAISAEEFENARLTPKCIVEHYLYADTALLLAAGATGKTTLQLYEAVHIILGRDLYGLRVITPGSVLIVTAEDSRELLVARLRKIVQGMNLSEQEIVAVRRGLRIFDVCGETARLVSADAGGNLSVTDIVDRIIDACRDDPPALIVFDPAISFGAGESRLNDNEQALINASRRIIKTLDCTVRYIHHIGKEASRNKIMDQYAGRSGSALPDGSRMVVVLQPWDQDSGGIGEISPPQHFMAEKECQIIVLNRPKLSYEPPQELMWIKRVSYAFESSQDIRIPPAAKMLEQADQIERFLRSELARDRYHTKTTLEAMHKDLGIPSRNGVRRVLAELEVSGRVVRQKRPDKEQGRGGAREFLAPADGGEK